MQQSAPLAKRVIPILRAVGGTLFSAASHGMMHQVNVMYHVLQVWTKIALQVQNASDTLHARTPILTIAELIFMMHRRHVSSHAQVDLHLSVLQG